MDGVNERGLWERPSRVTAVVLTPPSSEEVAASLHCLSFPFTDIIVTTISGFTTLVSK